MTDLPAPPIPLALAHLPVVAGLAVPWFSPRTGDGRFLFGVLDADRQRTCLTHRRCQICGKGLGRTLVLLARQSDLPRRCTAEPPAHPWSAAYTARACRWWPAG